MRSHTTFITGAGLPNTVPCTTINKVCSSGLKSITLACGQLQLGQAECIVAGGMESMTNVPYYLPKSRFGLKYGNGEVVDGLAYDGLSDAYSREPMGVCAELCADEFKISRAEQDDYAEESYRRAQHAQKEGYFSQEIVPVKLKKGTVDCDEEVGKVNFEKLRKLRTVFKKEKGTVTAGNASSISDGEECTVFICDVYLLCLPCFPCF
jgi:acetyl-CoA C-acetyltransferase